MIPIAPVPIWAERVVHSFAGNPPKIVLASIMAPAVEQTMAARKWRAAACPFRSANHVMTRAAQNVTKAGIVSTTVDKLESVCEIARDSGTTIRAAIESHFNTTSPRGTVVAVSR